MAQKSLTKKSDEPNFLPYQTEIAFRFRTWLRKHPKADIDDKIEAFNKIADEVIGN